MLKASESWLARDCLCSRSGRLQQLASRDGPGEVHLELAPPSASAPEWADDTGEDSVLLRVVAINHLLDPQDWRALGAAVVLRLDARRTRVDERPAPHWPLRARPARGGDGGLSPAALGAGGLSPAAAGTGPEHAGVRVRQLLDFGEEVRKDLESYCAAHGVCASPGSGRLHVCLHEPCPFRPINLPKYDDHREAPFARRGRLGADEGAAVVGMRPDTHAIVSRHIKPMTEGAGRSLAMVMNQEQPLEVSVFVTHSWAEDFADLLATLQVALDREEVVFLSAFSLDQHAAPWKGDYYY